jgi:hypothetical protein
LAEFNRGKVVPEGVVAEIEAHTKVKEEAGISIPSPRLAVPRFEVADVIFSLGKLEQKARQDDVEEIKTEAKEINSKLQNIYPEAVAVSELLLDYLESHKKVDDYCHKMINKLLELIRSHYFREL